MITQRDRNRIAAAVVAGSVGLALAEAASAVDLRDWGNKSPASERFVVLSQFNNQAVLDKETQVVWQRTPSSSNTAWHGAKYGCVNLVLGGRRGWRLPSFHELTSLTQPDFPIGVPALPAGHPFTNVLLGFYWTATEHIGSALTTQFAYVVHIYYTGSSDAYSTNALGHYWCVRGGGPLSLY